MQLTNDGKFLSLVLSFSPIGLKHKTMCRFILHLLTKNSHNYIPEMFNFYFSAISLTSLSKFSLSSAGYKLGISPILSKLLISSKNFSWTN